MELVGKRCSFVGPALRNGLASVQRFLTQWVIPFSTIGWLLTPAVSGVRNASGTLSAFANDRVATDPRKMFPDIPTLAY